jgi:N-methylhydantoinase A
MTGTGRYRVSVDIGGTFVDAVEHDRHTGQVRIAKAPTTPANPAEGVLAAIERLGTPLDQTAIFVHGTTLGLNAIIERKGGGTGLITNEGFRDVVEIGRGDVPPAHMFDFRYRRAAPVVARRFRRGVRGRLDAHGREVEPLDEAGVVAAARELEREGVGSIAIAFLHSWRNPGHERRAAELVRSACPGLAVSVSSEVAGEYREVERTTTALLDAYIRPIIEAYLTELEAALKSRGFGGRFLVMRSSGGAMSVAMASRAPLLTVMSGPAGGIVGSAWLALQTDKRRFISLDFGGTSLDAAVIEDGRPSVLYETSLGGAPVLMPTFDIRCIGAGGGSIAWVEDRLLRVGPRSAGARPGPIAYGRGGTEPTTTDAALVLGYIDPANFNGGSLPLDAAAAARGLEERVARPLGTDLATAAAGMFDILVAKTVGAVREITVERGKDPAEFSLLSFGGAGGMLTPLVLRELGAAELVVPNLPAAFSAWGMLMSDLVYETSATALSRLDARALADAMAGLDTLAARATEAMTREGVPAGDVGLERLLECRYLGQEHAIAVPVGPGDDAAAVERAFNALHRERHGHAMQDPIQIATLRVRATGRVERPALPKSASVAETSVAPPRTRPAYCLARRATVPFGLYQRSELRPGHRLEGPAIVDEPTSTTVVHSDQVVTVDAWGQLIVRQRAA